MWPATYKVIDMKYKLKTLHGSSTAAVLKSSIIIFIENDTDDFCPASVSSGIVSCFSDDPEDAF